MGGDGPGNRAEGGVEKLNLGERGVQRDARVVLPAPPHPWWIAPTSLVEPPSPPGRSRGAGECLAIDSMAVSREGVHTDDRDLLVPRGTVSMENRPVGVGDIPPIQPCRPERLPSITPAEQNTHQLTLNNQYPWF